MVNMGKWVESQNYILEHEMIEAKAKEMQTEIDREILWGMLEGMGWHRIMLPNDIAMVNATAIKEWLTNNCNNAYEKYRSDFIFEDSKDANWFTLRWMT
jgi:hypothetical protein